MSLPAKTLVLAGFLLFQSQDQYPGQSEHAVPPDGWMCEHQNIELSIPVDHMCSCERMYSEELGRVVEDKTCSVYCHMDHCACPIDDPREHPKVFNPFQEPR